MLRRPPRSTLFPTRRSSDLAAQGRQVGLHHEVAIALVPTRRRVTRHGLHVDVVGKQIVAAVRLLDRKSTRLNSSHVEISYAVFCLKKKKKTKKNRHRHQNVS